MIVKIQVPLYTNGAPTALIYNRDRKLSVSLPVDDEIKKLMGDRLKAYFNAHIDKDGKLVIDSPAPDQPW